MTPVISPSTGMRCSKAWTSSAFASAPFAITLRSVMEPVLPPRSTTRASTVSPTTTVRVPSLSLSCSRSSTPSALPPRSTKTDSAPIDTTRRLTMSPMAGPRPRFLSFSSYSARRAAKSSSPPPPDSLGAMTAAVYSI